MTLERTNGTNLKSNLVPWADGDKVKTNGSFTTPWRTLQIISEQVNLFHKVIGQNAGLPVIEHLEVSIDIPVHDRVP